MNLDALIWIILSIFGAASIAGGVVLYSKSKGPYARALGAASAVAGIVMLGIVLVTLPVSQAKNGTPEPAIHYQEHLSGEWQQYYEK
jgi:hypothetical protein